MLPPTLRTNFQDLQAWRSGAREVLDLVARNHEGPVIVPMTLINSRYFTQIIAALPIIPDTDGRVRRLCHRLIAGDPERGCPDVRCWSSGAPLPVDVVLRVGRLGDP